MSKKFTVSIQPLPLNKTYYIPKLDSPTKTSKLRWLDCQEDYINLHRCMVFTSKKHAKRAANMLLKYIQLHRKTINPLTEEPEQGQVVYLNSPTMFPSIHSFSYCRQNDVCKMFWQRGLLHKTHDAAEIAALMLLGTLYTQSASHLISS